MEIKIERFELGLIYGDATMDPEPEGEWVRFTDVLSALKGLIAITDQQLEVAYDDGYQNGLDSAQDVVYDEAYQAGREDEAKDRL